MDAFRGRENMLKGISTVASILALGITAASRTHLYLRVSEDEFALAMTILALIYSIVLVVLILLKKMPATDQSYKIEAIIYFVFAVLLGIAAIVFLVRTIKMSDYILKADLATRVFALIFQLATAVIFAWILYEIYKKIKK